MSVAALFNEIPFVERLGMEVVEADEGVATARLPVRADHSSNPASIVVHGGVTYSLADTVGGAAAVSLAGRITPTVDMRIDYLEPATNDLRATGEVVRNGGSVAVVDVEVYDADDHHVATARGTYKSGGENGQSPWTDGLDEAAVDGLTD